MGCTPSGQEERVTAKGVGSKLLPQIRQLREALRADLDSLKYLRTISNRGHSREEGHLVIIEDDLLVVERRLRLLGGM